MPKNQVRVSLPQEMILQSDGKNKGVICFTDGTPMKQDSPNVYQTLDNTQAYLAMYESLRDPVQLKQANTINIESNLSNYPKPSERSGTTTSKPY